MIVHQSATIIFSIIAIYSFSSHVSLVSAKNHHHHHATTTPNSEKRHRKLENENDLLNFENDRCTTIVVGPQAGSEGDLI